MMRLNKQLTVVAIFLFGNTEVYAQLNQDCVINILNRTVQVSSDGGWSLPNVPSTQGRVRARATCIDSDGATISGQSDYFEVVTNGVTNVGEIVFQSIDPIPQSLDFSSNTPLRLTSLGATTQLTLTARYQNGTTQDVTAASNGTNYATTNSSVITIDNNGLVTATGNGFALITARKDGVLVVRRALVSAGGDQDKDGLPDDYEEANGLNPADPIDALEDQDKDGLSALDEYNAGTDPNDSDSDNDGLLDGNELTLEDDGYTSDPLLVDTDGDGLNDQLEVLLKSDPRDPLQANYQDALTSIQVTPNSINIINNTIDNTAGSQQITVSGTLLDGTNVDLTSVSRGTNYSSSNLTICNFGLESGLVFGSATGQCEITVSIGSFSQTIPTSVVRFDPVAHSSIAIPGYANNVFASNNYAYVASGSAGLTIVNVSDPKAPTIVSQFDTAGTAIDIKVLNNLAYVADGNSGLVIIDISSVSNPTQLSSLDTTGQAQDLSLQDTHAYIADGSSGIQVVDISEPALPLIVGQISGMGTTKGIDTNGSIAAVGSTTGLHIIDISSPETPKIISSLSIIDIKDLVIEGNYVHVAAYNSGYLVVDISVPNRPSITHQERGVFVPRDVEINGNIALYAEQLFPNAIAYVNLTNIQRPVFQGTIDLRALGDYAHTGISINKYFAYITAENFVVRSDFGNTGNTVLMVAQYRQITDEAGIPPQIDIIEPTTNQQVIAGESIVINIQATDDILVSSVDLLVDDVVVESSTSQPYNFTFTIPNNANGPLRLVARATDIGGNSALAERIIEIVADPGTEVIGRVIDSSNNPVVGARVFLENSLSTLSTEDGSFKLENVPTTKQNIEVLVEATIDGAKISSRSTLTPVVRAGTTDVGNIVIGTANAMVVRRTGVTSFSLSSISDVTSVMVPFGNTPGDCSITADGNLGFATDFANSLWVFDLTKDALAEGVNPIAISNPGEDTSLTPNGNHLLVCDGGSFSPISVVDINTRTEIAAFRSTLGGCNAVDVCSDGSVLQGFLDNMARLTVDSNGQLTETGEQVPLSGVININCAPNSQFGVALSHSQLTANSFRREGLTIITSRNLTSTPISAVFSNKGDKLYIRAVDAVIAYDFSPTTGQISEASLWSISTPFISSYYGMDQIAITKDDQSLLIPGPLGIAVHDALSGTLLRTIEALLDAHTGVCVPQ